MARELSPQGIHVAHFVIDGGIRSARRPDPTDNPDSTLDPDAIAAAIGRLRQPRSAWTWEMEMRPWVEKFYVKEIPRSCPTSRIEYLAAGSGVRGKSGDATF